MSCRYSGRVDSGEHAETEQQCIHGQVLDSGPVIVLVYRNGTERASTGFDGLIFISRRFSSKYLLHACYSKGGKGGGWVVHASSGNSVSSTRLSSEFLS